MINFAVKAAPAETEEDKIRKLVVPISTAVLVIYLVVVAGLMGWKWYWSDKEEADQSSLQEIATQVEQKSKTEILMRKLAARSQSTADYINSRASVYEAAQNLVDDKIRVKSWNYTAMNTQVAELGAEDTSILKDFVDLLTKKYQNVQINQANWSPTDGWVNTVGLGGKVR